MLAGQHILTNRNGTIKAQTRHRTSTTLTRGTAIFHVNPRTIHSVRIQTRQARLVSRLGNKHTLTNNLRLLMTIPLTVAPVNYKMHNRRKLIVAHFGQHFQRVGVRTRVGLAHGIKGVRRQFHLRHVQHVQTSTST